jgi:hypothetical protein
VRKDDDVKKDVELKVSQKSKSYSLSLKSSVLQWINASPDRTAYKIALHFKGGIKQSTMRGWILDKDNIKMFFMNKKDKRVPGGGNIPILLDREDFLADIIRMERA